MQLNIIVPVLMSCAMMVWISRRMSWTKRLTVAAITLIVIVGILVLERTMT